MKSTVSALLFIVFVLGSGYFVSTHFRTTPSTVKYSNEMSGSVKSMGPSIITVEGYISNLPPEDKKIVTVQISINPGTVFKAEKLFLDFENHKSGEFFKPSTTIGAGQASDIKVGTFIKLIKTEDNLIGKKVGVAKEITYSTIDYGNQKK